MDLQLTYTLIAGALIAATGGILGSFALLRRMALVGDALSHVALPGIGLGLLFHFNPILGGLAFLLFGVLLIWLIERKTELPSDTVVGVFFAISLAIGAVITPEHEILEALFGDISQLSLYDAIIASGIAVLISISLLKLGKKVSLSLISSDLAQAIGIRAARIELIFLLLFALTVAIGIQYTGALLMGALVIIPAAASRNLAGSMAGYLKLSAVFGIIGAVGGILISNFYNLSPGPSFVLVAGVVFFLSVIFKKRN